MVVEYEVAIAVVSKAETAILSLVRRKTQLEMSRRQVQTQVQPI
ncbi:hypothetical protein [Nostoc sp. CHAB 5836]|nr:hypothetical protein [Nostoc sp. CHAB 5836]